MRILVLMMRQRARTLKQDANTSLARPLCSNNQQGRVLRLNACLRLRYIDIYVNIYYALRPTTLSTLSSRACIGFVTPLFSP